MDITLKEVYELAQEEANDKDSGYYIEPEEFERVTLKTVKNGYKRRDGVNLPDIIKNLSNVKSMEVRDDDVFSIGFPKSGTTWVEEILWLLRNDFDYERVKMLHHYFRVFVMDQGASKKRCAEVASPRLIKSHLQLKFMPDELSRAKVVYILRNPKDVVVSNFNFFSTYMQNQFIGTMDELVDMFVEGETMYGAWYEHVNAYTSLPGVYIIHYEDLVEDPYNEIRKLAEFIGKHPTEEQLTTLIKFISFDNLKNLKTLDLQETGFFTPELVFFNQGKIGNWKNHLTEEQSRKIDEMLEKKVTYKRPFQFEPKKKF